MKKSPRKASISASNIIYQDKIMRDEITVTQKSLLLDEMTPDEIEKQNQIIEYWIDEIQENAM